MQKRNWRRWKSVTRNAAWMLWMLSTVSCHRVGPQFYCPVEPAYDQNGAVDKTSYRVKTDCYKSMTEKVSACYAEVAK